MHVWKVVFMEMVCAYGNCDQSRDIVEASPNGREIP